MWVMLRVSWSTLGFRNPGFLTAAANQVFPPPSNGETSSSAIQRGFFSSNDGGVCVSTKLVLPPQRFVEVGGVFKKRVSLTPNEVVGDLWSGLMALVASPTEAAGRDWVWRSPDLKVEKLGLILRLDSGRVLGLPIEIGKEVVPMRRSEMGIHVVDLPEVGVSWLPEMALSIARLVGWNCGAKSDWIWPAGGRIDEVWKPPDELMKTLAGMLAADQSWAPSVLMTAVDERRSIPARVWDWTQGLGPGFDLKPKKGQFWNWAYESNFNVTMA